MSLLSILGVCLGLLFLPRITLTILACLWLGPLGLLFGLGLLLFTT